MPTNRGSAKGIQLHPTGCPSPGSSPLVPRGEGRIRSRFDRLYSHPPYSERTGDSARVTSPPQFGGEAGREGPPSDAVRNLPKHG
jgi:hypothetical protein